ncbi:DUF4143 domain-containing protein [Paeniglutamicibacter terrestris]|uniref:DUF4143 domain-containing protein n=1 Tax=Paeniglutamicibacter terrestris TaxID=2723403 RepID=A0ABX1G700_9MICC|nr:DUF4143 domain-containing protein [Paeniglutamicibacter terrestris]NKG21788.1 DUF4143 domain-containing protein [Paeniglutamicibacter terrestris]
MQVQRFIQPTLIEYMATTPVVIVEGARAVGKTWLLRELQKANLIAASFTLTEPTQLAAATDNPLAWLRSLPTPFAIDEAQLLPELPLALKALLDETDESVRCVLTGSAAIGQTGLGGTDPLARRSARLTLEPLTEAELAATELRPWSVIDLLFDGSPTIGKTVPLPLDWAERMIRGGLPRYRIMNAGRSLRALHRQIEQDIKAVLTDDVLPGERNDSRIAHDVLTHLLMHPGGELNTTAISKSIGIDTRTVNRYIDILERRFLLDEIPNFHRPSKKSSRTTAKCYPADSALSGSVLLATGRTMTDAMTRGGMMETHIVQQIKAHLGWAEIDVNLTHWRENKNGRTSEVDLVLEDNQGRLVAIEIKAAGAISSSHFKGIRAFKNYYGERFHRGFVIGTGEQAVAFDKDLWALPLTSLSNLELWNAPEVPERISTNDPKSASELEKEDVLPALEEAQIFISYTHQDQDSSTGGDIRQFAADVVDALDGLHGRTVKLFLDVKDVGWGEDLWSRLDQELQASTFLMPFISPRYLKSDGCRREFTSFSEAAQRNASEQLLLPLIWITPPALRSETLTDPVVERLKSTLYLDVTAARRADRGSADYGNLVELVADRLEQVITDREALTNSPADSVSTKLPDGEPEPGFDEYLANAEALLPQTEEALETFVQDFTDLGEALKESFAGLQTKNPTQLRASMVRVGSALKQPNEKLTISAHEATRVWDQLLTNLNRGFSLYSEMDASEMPPDFVETLQSWADQLEAIDSAEVEGIAQQMPKMSSKLAPTSKALLSAVGTLRSMETSIRSWLTAVGQPK